MKNLLLAAVATVPVVAPVAHTQGISDNISTDGYARIDTNLEGSIDLTIGTVATVYSQETFAELTWVTAGDQSYAITAGGLLSLWAVSAGVSATYSWDNIDTQLIGLGDSNEWGDIEAAASVSVAPGWVGGEYGSVIATVDIESPTEYTWTGGAVVAGYKLELSESATIDAKYTWDVSSDWEVSDRALSVGLSVSF